MAKLKLDSINYCAAGTQGKFLNLDYTILNPDGTEEKKVTNATFVTDYRRDNEVFFEGDGKADLGETTNEFGFNIIGTKNIAHPLFDFKDLRIQSNTGRRMKKNYGIGSDTNTGKTTLEIYSPHLTEDPLEYTQLDDYIYCLTDKTNVGPVFKRSDIYLQKRMLSAERSTTTTPIYSYYHNPYDSDEPKYQISGDLATIETLVNHVPVYTYTPQFDLRLSGEEHFSELCATPISSYYQYLQSYGEYANSMLSTLFKPRYNFEDIYRNYILEVPVRRAKYDYSDGTIKGDLLLAKNVYDESYSMRLSSTVKEGRKDPNQIQKFREYMGIGSCGGYVFLKYYDDVTCNISSFTYPRTESGNVARTGLIEGTANKELSYSIPKQRTYQKVEQIRSINRYIATTKHKSNLFSVNINHLDTALDYSDFRTDSEARQKIKEDIDVSIRNLVKNFSPAHAQYYKTTFENNKSDNGC